LKLPPDNRLRTPPVTPWAISLLKPRQIASIAVLFIPGLNIYAAGFLSGMIGSKGDLKQGILGALTAGFNLCSLCPCVGLATNACRLICT
jgi:hypothetical protein